SGKSSGWAGCFRTPSFTPTRTCRSSGRTTGRSTSRRRRTTATTRPASSANDHSSLSPEGRGIHQTAPLGQFVQSRAVVPENLGLGLLADAFEAGEFFDGDGEKAVGVRVVGGDDDVVVADRLHHLAERLLVGVGGDVAL